MILRESDIDFTAERMTENLVEVDTSLQLDGRSDTFWTLGLPVGVHSNRPCLSVRLSVHLSVFKYLRDFSVVFSETLHEVRGQLSKKSETAEILKKNLNPGIKGD